MGERDEERRRRPFWDPFGFWRIFEEINREIERIMREMEERGPFHVEKTIPINAPGVHGFIHFSRTGYPVRADLNLRCPPRVVEEGVREPLTDVYVKGDEVYVVVELPGASKDEIELSATESELEIKTTGKYKYHAIVPLPEKVDPEKATAKYSNGVLEVRLKIKGRGRGRKVEIE